MQALTSGTLAALSDILAQKISGMKHVEPKKSALMAVRFLYTVARYTKLKDWNAPGRHRPAVWFCNIFSLRVFVSTVILCTFVIHIPGISQI